MKKQRQNPAINAGSMADIAFLLLVFFLVTTTVNSETGIKRKLPPKGEDTSTPIPDRNVLSILINDQNQIMVEGKLSSIDELQQIADRFLDPNDFSEQAPKKKSKSFGSYGHYPVSSQVISIESGALTDYGMFISIQDVLSGSYYKSRNDISLDLFGQSLADLEEKEDHEKLEIIKEILPQRISEVTNQIK